MWFTVGKTSVQWFLEGSKRAISDMAPAFKESFKKLKDSGNEAVQNSSGWQRFVLGQKKLKTAEDFSKITEQNAKLVLADREKYYSVYVNPIQDKINAIAEEEERLNNRRWSGSWKKSYDERLKKLAEQKKLLIQNRDIQEQQYEIHKKDVEATLKTPEQAADEYNAKIEEKNLKSLENMDVRVERFAAVGQTAAAAFTAAFTTAMLTDDPGEVFKSTMISGATAAVPGIMNTFNEALKDNEGDITAAFLEGIETGFISLAITLGIAAISAGGKALSNYIKQTNEENLKLKDSYYAATKQLEELAEAEKTLGKNARDTASAAEETRNSYESLAQKAEELEELRNKVLLTSDESQRLAEVSNEIAEIAPQLVSSYDAEGNAVIKLSDYYKELLEDKKAIMLQDQQAADEATLEYNKNRLTQAFESRTQAEELYNKVNNPKDDDVLQYFLQNPQGVASKVAEGIREGLYGTNAFSSILAQGGALPEYQGFTEAELGNLGYSLKQLLQDNKDFTFISSLENEDVYKEIQKRLKQQPDLLDKMNKIISQVSDNYAKYDYEITASINALIGSKKNAIDTQLLINSKTYSNADRNTQDIIQSWILGTRHLSVENIEQSFQNLFPGLEKGSEGYNKALEKYIDQVFDDIEIDTDAVENKFTASVLSVLSQLDTLKLDLPELLEYLQKVLPEDVFGTIVGLRQTEIDAYNKNIKELANLSYGASERPELKSGAGGILTTSDERITQLMSAQYIDDYVEKLQQYYKVGERNKFFNLFEGLNTSDIVEIFNINWDKVSAVEYEEQINALIKATKKNKSKIEKIVQSLHLFDYVPSSEEAFKEELKERYKAYDKYDKKIKAYKTAGDSWAKDGKVSQAGIEALYDAGFDLSELIDENLQFNQQRASEIIKEQLEKELTLLEVQREQTLEYRKQLQLVVALSGAYTTQELLNKGFDVDVINRLFTQTEDGWVKNTTYVRSQLAETARELTNWDNNTIALRARINALLQEELSVSQGIAKEQEEAANKIAKAQQAVAEAYDDILEKQESLIEKQEALNKALYGSGEARKNKTDELYNYATALDVLEERIKDAKDALDDLEGRDPVEFLEAWLSGTHGKVVNLQATNDRYAAAISNIEQVLNSQLVSYLSSLGRGISTNVSDYYSYNSELDRYEINYQALNMAQMNDELKDFIEEQVDLMNQHKKNIKKNQDEIKQLEKEFKEYQRKLRDNYISVQESIAKTLEDYYKKEVEDKEKMYSALEEADNKYLDALSKAIEKERKLRDKETKWDDLATKEKKLSLLQRDTSGANQKAVQSLQKEIEKDRRSMLDSAVDDVVNNLKELYETQKETRDIEIKYQEALLENANYIAEANSLLQSWKTVDEMRDWMWEHTVDIDKMSDEAVEKLTEDWSTMFDTIQIYNALTQQEIGGIFEVSAAEVQQVVLTTSETLTTEAERALAEVSEDVSKSIKEAEKAVEDAMKALTDAQTKYNEKIGELNELIGELGEKIRGFKNSNNEGYVYVPFNPDELEGAAADAYNAYQTDHTNPNEWKPISEINDDYELKKALHTFSLTDEEINSIIQNGYSAVKQPLLSIDIQRLKDIGFVLGKYNGMDYIFKNSDEFYKWQQEDPMHRSGANMITNRESRLSNRFNLSQMNGISQALLNTKDMASLGETSSLFSSLSTINPNQLASGLSQSIGDTTNSVNIYVESIATEDQVDYLINRMKQEFVNTANPIGTPIILHH